MVESKEELKSLLMIVTEEREKAGLKLNIQKTKVMAPSPTTSWQMEREKVEEESERVGLKLSIQKTKIMASGPITSWQIDGETMK